MGDKSNWKNKNRTIEKFFERAGGTAEGKPHSEREGRIAAGKRGLKRYVQSLPKGSLRPMPKKYKVLKSPGSWPTVTIKVPKRKK